eukprot:4980627-Karenia_brevis.AAC.1
MSTFEIWQSWNKSVVDSLYSSLADLANDLEMEVPPAKAFSTHGAPTIKEVPIFQKVAHIHSSSSTSSLIPGIALSTQHLKQIRRLQ